MQVHGPFVCIATDRSGRRHPRRLPRRGVDRSAPAPCPADDALSLPRASRTDPGCTTERPGMSRIPPPASGRRSFEGVRGWPQKHHRRQRKHLPRTGSSQRTARTSRAKSRTLPTRPVTRNEVVRRLGPHGSRRIVSRSRRDGPRPSQPKDQALPRCLAGRNRRRRTPRARGMPSRCHCPADPERRTARFGRLAPRSTTRMRRRFPSPGIANRASRRVGSGPRSTAIRRSSLP